MTDTPEIARIRTALTAGPTPGPWIGAGPAFGKPLPVYLDCVVQEDDVEDCTPTICRDAETADAGYIAACNPAAITAVLAHIDAQAAEIERLRAENERLRADAGQMRETLASIGNADPRKWEELACQPTEFERWAKSRANRAIVKSDAATKEQP